MANVRMKTLNVPGLDNTYTFPEEAPDYSSSATYAVGDFVIYNGKLYRCTTAISTAEVWTAGHWAETKMGNEVSTLKTAISDVVIISESEPTSDDNRIWINSDADSVQVPTMGDINELIDAIFPTGTITNQAVATFSDGAKNIPVKSLIVDIDAVQSGSGDPSPTNIRSISGWTKSTISRSGEDTSDPTTYEILFPSAAGTVYGGNIKWTAVNGWELTVDTMYGDLGDYSWQISSAQHGSVYAQNVPIDAYGGTSAAMPFILSDALKVVNMYTFNNSGGTSEYIITVNGQNRIYVMSMAYAGYSEAQVKTALTGIHFAAKMATPIEYTLTSAEVIKTLQGVNNIWADTGNINTLVYRKDIVSLIDSGS